MRWSVVVVVVWVALVTVWAAGPARAAGAACRNGGAVACDRAFAGPLRRFADGVMRADGRTVHVWEADVVADAEAGAAVRALKASAAMDAAVAAYVPPGGVVVDVDAMNELYVSVPELGASKGSDVVFVTEHMDGPYGVVPGATLLRCLYMVAGNAAVHTVFPLAAPNTSYALDTGELLCFDYNREVHFIRHVGAAAGDGVRIAMKLHVAIAPQRIGRWYAVWFGRINAAYNAWARSMFLASQHPDEYWYDWAISAYINTFTVAGTAVERVAGVANVLMLAGLAVALAGLRWRSRRAAVPFAVELVYGCTLLHYCCYVFAYLFRSVAFGIFVRDALFLKTLAMCGIAYAYVSSVRSASDLGPVVLAAPGFVVSYLAYAALGDELTYFGIEMGHAEPEHITAFPYGVIPHPMILGSVFGFAALCLAPAFRATWAPLMALHIAHYAVVLALEVFDIHLGPALFAELGTDFLAFHTVPANVVGHLATVGVGMAAFFGAVGAVSRPLCLYLLGVFVIALRYTVEPALAQVAELSAVLVLVPFAVLAVAPVGVFRSYLGVWQYVGLAVVAFVAQEACHRFTWEKTFMDSYFAADPLPVVALKLLLHNLWLAPYTVWAFLAL